MSSHKRASKIGGQFSWRLGGMIASPAFRVLSLSANRILNRLELEICQHGGNDNGHLPCTYEHFVEYGVDRHSIAPAIRELVALGFIEYTPGAAGNAEFRKPNTFRLTYRPTGHRATFEPTDEWKRIRTIEEAQQRARMARKAPSREQPKNKTPVGRTHTEPDGENPHRNV